jgi:23S rRNA (uracil1939-C5)-methyltransferase
MATNFELAIEKLVYGGEALGRVDGRVVLTPFALPGERVRAAAETERSSLVRARVESVITPAAGRIEPACGHFARCGGCHYQHASYDLQLEAKRDILREVLRRIAKIDWTGEIGILAAEPWGYRNRAQFRIEDGRIGFREARSHKLCAIDSCPVSSPRINETLAALGGMMGDPRWPRFVGAIELFTNESEVQMNVLESDRPVARRFFEWCGESIPGAAGGALEYRSGAFLFRVSGKSFFQVNRFLVESLVEAGVGEARGTRALDLYAGVGLFSLALGGRFSHVTAVESGKGAADDLTHNALRAGVPVDVVRADASRYLAGLEQAPDFVLADPPRAGLGPACVSELIRLAPRDIAVVSCDPATLARDLAGLLCGGFRIVKLTLADLFPQTYHIETVARLERTT